LGLVFCFFAGGASASTCASMWSATGRSRWNFFVRRLT